MSRIVGKALSQSSELTAKHIHELNFNSGKRYQTRLQRVSEGVLHPDEVHANEFRDAATRIFKIRGDEKKRIDAAQKTSTKLKQASSPPQPLRLEPGMRVFCEVDCVVPSLTPSPQKMVAWRRLLEVSSPACADICTSAIPASPSVKCVGQCSF